MSEKLKLSKILNPIFFYRRGDRELEVSNFTGTLADGGTFEWKYCFFKPGLTPSACCNSEKNNVAAFAWITFIRTLLFILTSVYFGKDVAANLDGFEPFILHPNRMIYLCILYYYVVTTIGYCIYSIPQILNEARDGQMPRVLRVAWVAYTMALPASLVSLIAYCSLSTNENQTIQASYICNFCFWFMDLFVGRMILYPGHWLHYSVFWALYGVFYMWHLLLADPEDGVILIVNALKVGVLGQVCFVLTSTITYIRSNRIEGGWPIMYGPKEDPYALAAISTAELGTDDKEKQPEPI